MDSEELARVVRFHRRRAGLTQHELAKLAGVGKTVVFDLEKGKEGVRFSTLLRITNALNILLEWTSPLRDAFLEERHPDRDTEGEDGATSSGLR